MMNMTTNDISSLSPYGLPTYICSTAWIRKGNILAMGFSNNIVELWDVDREVCLRRMKSHKSRVGSLSWNSHVLTSGSRNGDIHNHDVRIAEHHVSTLKTHLNEVCGLKWNHDGRYLASGGSDNLVAIWDSVMSRHKEPINIFRSHSAAVKAVAWCPWESSLLATGGDKADNHIKIWNIHSGQVVHELNTMSQVSDILWSRHYRELISSHGSPNNQLSIWKYPQMSKVCDLKGHLRRVSSMVLSPDEETVTSVSTDETLRFWKCFEISKKQLSDRPFAATNRSCLSGSIR
jgi:cell division cycle protein 20 (cofactor of APC complex)